MRMRLFCLPYAGGSARIFQDWVAPLRPHGIDVVALELPGRGLRFAEPPEEDLDLLVEDLMGTVMQRIELPVAIFGHSLGGLLGYELARRLEREIEPPVRLVVSGIRAPDSEPDGPPASELPPAEFERHLRGLGGTPQELLDNDELMTLMIPVLRADFHVADTYRWRPGPPLGCPITAFGSPDDPEVSMTQLHGWARHTGIGFAARLFPGDHFFLHTARDAVLGQLAGELSGQDDMERTRT